MIFIGKNLLEIISLTFFASELMLAIEIDGISHDEKIANDKKRQKHLESLGIIFLRFNDLDVKRNMEGVLLEIEKWIDDVVQ